SGGNPCLVAPGAAIPGGAGAGARVPSFLALSGPSGLLVYGDSESEGARLDALPPEKTETLLEQARFQLKSLDVTQALASLRAWKSSAPIAPQPNSALD